jgi:hypothetical protein
LLPKFRLAAAWHGAVELMRHKRSGMTAAKPYQLMRNLNGYGRADSRGLTLELTLLVIELAKGLKSVRVASQLVAADSGDAGEAQGKP